jgi:hypothetical protein
MNSDKNKKQRKFDYVANLLNYSINLNRDSDIQLDYTFTKPKQFQLIMDREFPNFQYTNNLCSLIDYSVYEMDELNKKITRFVNGLN